MCWAHSLRIEAMANLVDGAEDGSVLICSGVVVQAGVHDGLRALAQLPHLVLGREVLQDNISCRRQREDRRECQGSSCWTLREGR